MREQLWQLRRDYSQRALSEKDLPTEPFDLLKRWLQDALSEGLVEPNAAALATVSKDGQPSVRAVLIRDLDETGLIFFTNYESRKASELSNNPRAALLFLWTPLERQVRVEGFIEKVSEEISDAYFKSRPRNYQLAAWASPQSQPIPDRKFLEDRYKEMEARFEGQEVIRPPFWGGFRLVPERIEFWQGRPNRLHDRFLYMRQNDGSWSIVRLAP
ncbi:MAG: pyridoxamine 5'-phosphate oxidase [Armatimonadetes bacterium]|nr:pyridoxamine 5'-phosphate oxidase [Armatimonadota bacterium]MDW8028351.1 pyridoxamine 5'-phosphate oxidase [Armatimonadota bacterium]